MSTRAALLGAFAAWLALAAPARAQVEPGAAAQADPAAEPPDDVARARKLAQQALDHLDAGRHAEALDAAEQAEALYHAPIHLRVVGEALEGLGRRADAAAVYDRIAAEPLPSTAHPMFVEAQAMARERLRELSAALPSILVKVPGMPDAEVTVAGKPYDARGEVALRLDPGAYRVRVTAPGRLPFDETVELEEGAGVVIVTARLRKPGEPDSDEPFVVTHADGMSMPPVSSWVLAGVGAAALIAGGVVGGVTLSKAGDLEARCPDKQCPPSAKPDHEQAEVLGWTSTVLLGVGAAAVVAGGVVWFVDMGADDDSAQLQIGPGSLGLRGRF